MFFYVRIYNLRSTRRSFRLLSSIIFVRPPVRIFIELDQASRSHTLYNHFLSALAHHCRFYYKNALSNFRTRRVVPFCFSVNDHSFATSKCFNLAQAKLEYVYE